jgi:hypothetical protein
MLALISIPHQTPAKLVLYDDRQEVIDAAIEYAEESVRPEPEDFDEAVHCLADDWHGFLLVESAEDLGDVVHYVTANKHQAHRIAVFVPEIQEAFEREYEADAFCRSLEKDD